MKKTVYKINRNQYLSDINPFKTSGIPTNIFLFKKLPGIGATDCELMFHRHSIIIESNVPVIIGKCNNPRHKGKILGVHEGVSVGKVIEYLNSSIGDKKIVVTPESFYKVKEATEESTYNLYTDFFLLFDECEKVIQDVSYREKIILPMDDFFQFKNKAFVSATPILPSDPRFMDQNFQVVEINPTFKYSQPLKLILANNVFSSLSKFLHDNTRDRYFIFFNTTDNIADFILKEKITDESKVFCAKDSMKKLKLNNFKNVSTEIKDFKKYNFLTSRFYSAVDIDFRMFDCNPTIIMVSDLVFAMHSKIDPFTESVQIPGRFRKPKNKRMKREIIHISNINPDITIMSEEEIANYLHESDIVYRVVERYLDGSSSIHAKNTLRQMLQRIDYAKYLKLPENTRNHFMVDNLIADELVNSYYQSSENLINAYIQCSHYDLVDPVQKEVYKYSDHDRLKAGNKKSPIKDLKALLTERLVALQREKDTMSEFAYNIEISNLQYDFPDQMAPVIKFGIENAVKFKFDIKAIEQELKKNKHDKDYFGMMTYIHDNFKISGIYSSLRIAEILRKGFDFNKIFGINPTVTYLRKFAIVSDSQKRISMGKDENGKEIKGYKIFKFLDRPV